jgi:hypothetical protein
VTKAPATLATAVAAAAILAVGCGGGDDSSGSGSSGAAAKRAAARQRASGAQKLATPSSTPGPGGKAKDYKRAETALRATDYDTAIKLMTALGDYRDAPKRVAEFRLVAARGKLAEAKAKGPHSAKAAVAMTKTSLKYHPTPQARAFLRKANANLVRFKRRQALGLEHR